MSEMTEQEREAEIQRRVELAKAWYPGKPRSYLWEVGLLPPLEGEVTRGEYGCPAVPWCPRAQRIVGGEMTGECGLSEPMREEMSEPECYSAFMEMIE